MHSNELLAIFLIACKLMKFSDLTVYISLDFIFKMLYFYKIQFRAWIPLVSLYTRKNSNFHEGIKASFNKFCDMKIDANIMLFPVVRDKM